MKKFDNLLIKTFICIFAICICTGLFGSVSHASKNSQDDFDLDAVLINNSDDNYYTVSITVTNNGKDFSGVVRFQHSPVRYDHLAYDTQITLPQNSTKQFNILIPRFSLNQDESGTSIISLINNRKKEVYYRTYTDFFVNNQDYLQMGILSDDYSSLTFLDLAGDSLTYYNSESSIQLINLDKDSLSEYLDNLTFLVIDDYDSSFLSSDQIHQIESWVYRGGTLLIGTDFFENTENPGKTILSFSPDFLGFDPSLISYENIFDFYANYIEANPEFIVYDNLQTIAKCHGNGSISVCFFPIKEIPSQQALPSFFTHDLIDYCSSNSSARYMYRNNSNYSSSNFYYSDDYLNNIVNQNCHYYPFLYVILMLLYVIFIGPILYILLKVIKKQEIYWVAVPASAVVMTLFIFVIGRGISLSSTEVVSITMTNTDTHKQTESIILAFDSGYKEWSFKSDEKTKAVGPLEHDTNYNYSYGNEQNNKYDYRFVKEGNHTMIGAKTSAPFQNRYFYALSDCMENGAITVNFDMNASDAYVFDPNNDSSLMTASNVTITNSTNRDFKYYAVYFDGKCAVYTDLKSGESVSLNNAKIISYKDSFKKITGSFDYYRYSYSNNVMNPNSKDKDILSALGLGIGLLSNNNEFFAIGVVEDYPGVSDDLSKEISYGCIYSTTIK